MSFAGWSILTPVFRGLATKYPEDKEIIDAEAGYILGAATALRLNADESERNFKEFMSGTISPLFVRLVERYPTDKEIWETHGVLLKLFGQGGAGSAATK